MSIKLKEPAPYALALWAGLKGIDLETKKIDEAPQSVQMEWAYAGTNFQWHWKTARDETGLPKPYDPWMTERPHLKQQVFHEASQRYRLFVGGRGSGKSRGGAAELVKRGIHWPGSVWILNAPTYKQLESSTKQAFFEILHPLSIHHYNKETQKLELTNGSVIWIRSTEDPETIRGINAAGFWFDEAAMARPTAWPILVGTMRQVGVPNVAWATTTPRGFNWVHEKFIKRGSKNYYTIVASSRDNPWNPVEFVEGLVEDYVGNFAAQEIEGLFVGFEGLVYPEFREHLHVVDEVPKLENTYYLHDWGTRDPTVVLVAKYNSATDTIYVEDEFYEEGVNDDDALEARSQFEEKYGKHLGIADSADAGAILKMNRAGHKTKECQKGPDSLTRGIRLMRQRIAYKVDEDDPKTMVRPPRLYIHKRCVNTISEFGMYQYDEDKEGKPLKEKPRDMFNHSMDCIRYLSIELETPRGKWKPAHSPELDKVLSGKREPDFKPRIVDAKTVGPTKDYTHLFGHHVDR